MQNATAANTAAALTNAQLLELAYAQHPNLPKAGDIAYVQGYEFAVSEPMVTCCTGNGGSPFTHQFTYTGTCTADERNNSIRNTGYNGGRYGYGINVKA